MADLTKIEGVGPSLAAALVKGNYLTIAQIAAATPIELSSVPGISQMGALRIVASARSLGSKPGSQKSTRKRSRAAVAPPKAGSAGRPHADKVVKVSEEKSVLEVKNTRQKEKIKKLKKKIRKLKKQKKKILAKDRKRS